MGVFLHLYSLLLAEQAPTEAQAQKPVQIVSLQNTTENNSFTEPINSNDYETTDEFRRLQEESNRTSNNETQLYHRGSERISNESRRTLATTYEGLLARNSGSISEFRTLVGKGNEFNFANKAISYTTTEGIA